MPGRVPWEMRAYAAVLLAVAALVQVAGQAPQPDVRVPTVLPVGTMSELMVRVIYPYSDAFFYIGRAVPKNDTEWEELHGKALALAEFGNLLMMPGRARDQDQWMRDARLLVEAGAAAVKAVKAKDVDAILALNEQLVTSCTSCHMHYRPNYGRRRQQPSQQ